MQSTGRHSYFNISNSNYKSLIDPQRLVEITGWNGVPTTKSAAIDHCGHQCNEGRRTNSSKSQITLLHQQITEEFDIAEWKREEPERKIKTIAAMKMMASGSEVYHSPLFLIRPHLFSQGTPLSSHNAECRYREGFATHRFLPLWWSWLWGELVGEKDFELAALWNEEPGGWGRQGSYGKGKVGPGSLTLPMFIGGFWR